MPFIDSRASHCVGWTGGTPSVRCADGDRHDHADVPQRVDRTFLAAARRAFLARHIRRACPCRKPQG